MVTQQYNFDLAGPIYPPPLGATLSSTDQSGNGAIGHSGGVTWTFSSVNLAQIEDVFWDAVNGGVKLSFKSGSYSNQGEVMTYSSSLSNPSGGVLVWTGSTSMSGYGTFSTKYTMTFTNQSNGQPLPLTDTSGFSSPANSSPLLTVTPGLSYSVNMRFDASTGGGGDQSAYDAINYYHPL